jgi:amphi-Trp domain-containing protein
VTDESMIEVETEEELSREEAAAKLRAIADQLSKQNQVSFSKGGLPMTAKVPAKVKLSVEVEITDDGGELEVEITW